MQQLFQTPLPPTSLWEQLPVLGVFVLFMVVIFAGLLVIWKEFVKWSKEQEAQRKEERKTQRDWESEQERVRMQRWGEILQRLQASYTDDNQRNREKIAEVTEAVFKMSDNILRLSEMVMRLDDTLTGHIAIDDARFDLLLTEAQRDQVAKRAGAAGRKK